jgi:hypothetical protein
MAFPVSTHMAPVQAARRPAVAVLLAIAGLIGIDSLLFRTNLYPSVLAPESSTGQFELTLWRERRAQQKIPRNSITGVGDSRFAYYPRLANQLLPETGYVFRSAGVPGSNPQSWYYMLRDLDPGARRYSAIMLGVDDYYDEDQWFEPDTDIRSLHYAIVRLRFTDVLDFARSFHGLPLQWQAFRGSLLKGLVLQPDLYSFLSDPQKRIDEVHLQHSGYEEWTYNYVESDRSLTGLTIDYSKMEAHFPPGATEDQILTVKAFLLRGAPPRENVGRVAAFRRTWFRRIIDRYHGSRTKIVFVRLPRGPIPRPDNLVPKYSSSIRELASDPNVRLCDEHAFESLEHPEFFKDGLHLNLEGATLFSHMLARELKRVIQ